MRIMTSHILTKRLKPGWHVPTKWCRCKKGEIAWFVDLGGYLRSELDRQATHGEAE